VKKRKSPKGYRPTLILLNDEFYVVDRNDEFSGFTIIRKSDGKVFGRDIYSFRWDSTAGFHRATRLHHLVDNKSDRVVLLKSTI
jgi:hypothetical protein